MFKKKKAVEITGNSWAVYTYVFGEGQRAIISFDVPLAEEQQHQGYEQCKRVIAFLSASRVSQNGLPGDKQISDQLHKFEDELVKLLEKQAVDCKFVGRMTYAGMREFVFQVENTEAFDKAINKGLQKSKELHVEIKASEGWQFFDEKIKPKPVYWMQIEDMQVIENLLKAGSNPNTLHMIEHVITGDKAKLLKVRDEMVNNGFKEISLDDSTLVIGKESRLNIDEIFNTTSRFFSYCPANGVTYDGWGAEVRK
jgi:regulator of RNase E activity RraB